MVFFARELSLKIETRPEFLNLGLKSMEKAATISVKYFGTGQNGELGIHTEYVPLRRPKTTCVAAERHIRIVKADTSTLAKISGKQLQRTKRREVQAKEECFQMFPSFPPQEPKEPKKRGVRNLQRRPCVQQQRRIHARDETAEIVATFRSRFRKQWYPGKEKEMARYIQELQISFTKLEGYIKPQVDQQQDEQYLRTIYAKRSGEEGC